MALSARPGLAAAIGAFVLAGAACGLDVVGTAVPDAAPPDATTDGVAPSDAADASGDGAPDGAPPDASTDADADAAFDAGPPFCDPTDAELVLCMRFESDVSDDSSHHQTIAAANVSYANGVHGKAATLGATSAMTIADASAWVYTHVTFETWVRFDATPPGGTRMGLLDHDLSFGVFYQPDNTVTCNMGAVVSASVPTGKWTHLACVADGAKTTLYIDGVAKSSTASGNVSQTNANIAIGGNSPSGDPLTGALDDLRVFARARTAAEIALDATP